VQKMCSCTFSSTPGRSIFGLMPNLHEGETVLGHGGRTECLRDMPSTRTGAFTTSQSRPLLRFHVATSLSCPTISVGLSCNCTTPEDVLRAEVAGAGKYTVFRYNYSSITSFLKTRLLVLRKKKAGFSCSYFRYRMTRPALEIPLLITTTAHPGWAQWWWSLPRRSVLSLQVLPEQGSTLPWLARSRPQRRR